MLNTLPGYADAASRKAASAYAKVSSMPKNKVVGLGLALILSFSVCASNPLAMADELDDQQQSLQAEADSMHETLEFLDAELAQVANDLVSYQTKLPAVQSALSEAQGRVSSAAREVESITARVSLAQENQAVLQKQLKEDREKAAATKKLVGQIAAQAYINGGVPGDLTLLLDAENSDLTGSMDLAGYAMTSQKKALDNLAQQSAQNENIQVRLVAVEEEISKLKVQASEALRKEEDARDEASTKKEELDRVLAETTRLGNELEAAKPEIQRKLESVQSTQNVIASEIAERDRRLREEWLAEEKRKADEANARAAAAAAAALAAAQDAAARAAAEEARRQAELNAAKPYVPPAPGPVSSFGLRSPFNAGVPITSGFGWRATPPGTIDFYGQGGYMHTGIDFGAMCGTPVYAATSGTITSAGWGNDGGGYRVRISHGVVAGNSLTTVYYHNSSVSVFNGQYVNRGDLIAYSGTTGNSTGCHSHFETWVNGVAVNPMNLL